MFHSNGKKKYFSWMYSVFIEKFGGTEIHNFRNNMKNSTLAMHVYAMKLALS